TRLLASLKRRSAHAKEFGHDVLFVKLEDIDALVEALEKAQGMESYWKTQCRGITDHCEELQVRIAELESCTVTVKLPKRSVGEVMHMSGFSRDYAEGWCAGNDNAIHQICNTPGIKWEAE
ncbi:hypothetical protein ACU637_09420, partial [Klebsiella aerogenes]